MTEAARSIESLRALSLQNPIFVHAPEADAEALHGVEKIGADPGGENGDGYAYKVAGIARFPMERFLFLDSDTYVAEPLAGLSEALASSGIAGVMDPLRDTFLQVPGLNRPQHFFSVSDVFPELNTGMLLINKARLPKNFFPVWVKRHEELCTANPSMRPGQVPDQPSLIQAIRECGVSPLYLPAEFNFRPCYPQLLFGKAKIVHVHADASTAFQKSAGVQSELSVTFPWGGWLSRRGVINRALFFVSRLFRKLIGLNG